MALEGVTAMIQLSHQNDVPKAGMFSITSSYSFLVLSSCLD